MAFDCLDNFTDELAKQYRRTENSSLLNVLVDYYSYGLQSAKFKAQREHCKNVIKELSPAFYEGYFKSKK